jgi:hypothetical protein
MLPVYQHLGSRPALCSVSSTQTPNEICAAVIISFSVAPEAAIRAILRRDVIFADNCAEPSGQKARRRARRRPPSHPRGAAVFRGRRTPEQLRVLAARGEESRADEPPLRSFEL